MKKRLSAHTLASFAILALAFGACTSTDIVDDPATSANNTISLSVASPDAYAFPMTRVDNGLKLRYVAKLYEGKTANESKFIARKELVSGENNNMIIFTNVEEGTYFVTLFADYIPANSTATDGCYPDCFYDTQEVTENVRLMPFDKTGEIGTPTLRTPINNDNYDCFALTRIVNKKAEVYEENLTLKRAVSKIRVISTEGKEHGVESIRIKEFDVLNVYSFSQGCANFHLKNPEISNPVLPVQTKEDYAFTPSNIDNAGTKTLFYFYSFGGPGNISLSNISFTIKGKNGFEYPERNIPSGTLKITPNNIYNVKGGFLVPSKDPEQEAADKAKEIHLTVDSNQNWDSETDK